MSSFSQNSDTMDMSAITNKNKHAIGSGGYPSPMLTKTIANILKKKDLNIKMSSVKSFGNASVEKWLSLKKNAQREKLLQKQKIQGNKPLVPVAVAAAPNNKDLNIEVGNIKSFGSSNVETWLEMAKQIKPVRQYTRMDVVDNARQIDTVVVGPIADDATVTAISQGQNIASSEKTIDNDIELVENTTDPVPTVVVLSDDENNGDDGAQPAHKSVNPVKQIIRKVMESVPACQKHVERIMQQQQDEQTEELQRYFDRELAVINAQIAKTQAELNAPGLSTDGITTEVNYAQLKRALNNRSSRLSRLNRKRREEMTRLSIFGLKQFNADLIQESKRFRAKIQMQLKFLADAGIDIDAFLENAIASGQPVTVTVKQEPIDQ